jgi:hypothetical protein
MRSEAPHAFPGRCPGRRLHRSAQAVGQGRRLVDHGSIVVPTRDECDRVKATCSRSASSAVRRVLTFVVKGR